MEGPTGKTFNFADSPEGIRSTPALMWLARRFDRPIDAWITGRGPIGSGIGVLWYHPVRRSPEALRVPRNVRFRHVEVASLRGSWSDKAAFWLAMKGGDNSANHSHLDIGTFVLEVGGQRFAIDLGADDYALPGYFSPDRRPGYYRISTAGHNTLLVDQANQPAAARAQIINFRSGPTFAYAVADLGPAYPALRAVRRGAALVDHRVAVIADEIEGAAGRSVRWQMHTRSAVALHGTRATLTQDGVSLHARIMEPADAVFIVESARQPSPENPNTGVSRLCIDLPHRRSIRLTIAFSLGASPTKSDLGRARLPLAAWAS
jgi:hypothetical protein